MLYRHGICRPSHRDITEISRLRELVREASELLKKLPKPDTFVGRKTQEPFPREIMPKSAAD